MSQSSHGDAGTHIQRQSFSRRFVKKTKSQLSSAEPSKTATFRYHMPPPTNMNLFGQQLPKLANNSKYNSVGALDIKPADVENPQSVVINENKVTTDAGADAEVKEAS